MEPLLMTGPGLELLSSTGPVHVSHPHPNNLQRTKTPLASSLISRLLPSMTYLYKPPVSKQCDSVLQ